MTTPHDKALKPCPFCGGEAAFEQTGRNELTLRCVGVQPSGLLGCGPKYVQKGGIRFTLEWLQGKMTENWNRRAPLPIAGKGDDGWNRDMDSAPRDKTPVIIAVPHKDNDAFIVGEAYFDPEHYGDGDWWWAGNSHGDYHGGPISEINYNGPSAWRPLPSPPSLLSEDTEGGV